METQIIQFLEKVGPWGVIGLFFFLILKPLLPEIKDWIRSKIPQNTFKSNHEEKLTNINENVIQIQKNHIHELRDLLTDIKDSALRQERITEKMSDNIIYIKSRINGKNN